MERLLKAFGARGARRGPRRLIRVTLGQDAKRKAPKPDEALSYDPVLAQADLDLVRRHDPLGFL